MSDQTPLSVVVLISGSGSNLQALIDGANGGNLPVVIRAVVSNEPDAYGLQRAAQAGIPARVLNHRGYSQREDYERDLINLIDEYDPGLVVLAGFMRILTPFFVSHYRGRLFNIHPSLLPKFRGLHTHKRALEAGEQTHGASVHFVTEELDGGPVVLQAMVSVLPGDDSDSLAARVLTKEHKIYPQVVRWFAEGRLALSDSGQVLMDGRILEQPLLLETPGEASPANQAP